MGQRLFPFKLAPTVGTQWRGRVAFGVGRAFGAIEDVIGGVVDDTGADPIRFLAQHAWRCRVDRHGQRCIGFGAVNSRIGSRIDDDLGLDAAHECTQRLCIRQIAVCRVHCMYLAQRRQCPLQFKSNLAVLAGQENLHSTAPYCLPIHWR